MGKYTRKAKMTVDVALMDVSQSYLGVRTRAKTLALKRLQNKPAAPPPLKPDSCYLELRSRRLEKPMQQRQRGCAEEDCFAIEPSFGENDLDSQVAERGTRESTPCSLIRVADTINAPGSTTKQKSSEAATPRVLNAFPSAYDLDQFFAFEEQPLQHHFTEKYNFDFMNDVPLAGRYEWVAVRP